MDTDYHSSKAQLQERRINAYISGRIQQQPHPQYTEAQIRHYLSWIAWQMRQQMLTTFQKEAMQPTWLKGLSVIGYQLPTRLILSICVGLIAAFLIGAPFIDIGASYLYIDETVVVFGVIVGISTALAYDLKAIVFAPRKTFPNFEDRFVSFVAFNIYFGMLALILNTDSDLLMPVLVFIITTIIFAFVGLIRVVSAHLFRLLNRKRSKTQKVVVSTPLVVSVDYGLKVGFVGALFGVVTSLIIDSPSEYPGITLVIFAVCFCLMSALFSGWLPVIQHKVLHFVLGIGGKVPSGRYDAFLDYCTDIRLLRKVDDGYIFRHRMLMEHLRAEYERKNGKRRDAS